jgi:hypothetical protein
MILNVYTKAHKNKQDNSHTSTPQFLHLFLLITTQWEDLSQKNKKPNSKAGLY